MMLTWHNVCITGYGLLSALPEDNQQLWQALNQFSHSPSTVNTNDFSHYPYHPLVKYDIEQQIIKQSDRRVMGKTMQSAVYTAGIALDRAQLKNMPELLQDTQIIVALRGGERDEAADAAIIEACNLAGEYGETLNKGLMEQLRPTLFLSQLPNLLAANIALLYGLTGSSVTLMGGEIGGAQAIQLAYSRIKSGEAQRVLVGGVSVNEANEIVATFGAAKKLLTSYVPVWQRTENKFCLGSGSGFLILESEESAKSRNVPILAKLSQCEIRSNMQMPSQKNVNILTMSHRPETAFKDESNINYVRSLASAVGTILEAAMPVGIILALQCLEHKKLFAPLDSIGVEKPQDNDQDITQLWVHCTGQTYGHAWTCVELL